MRQDKKKVTNNGFQFYRDPLNDSYSLQLGADKKGKKTKTKKNHMPTVIATVGNEQK